MSENKPVALWKGIVGVAVSGTILFFSAILLFLYLGIRDRVEIWQFLLVGIATGLSLIFLIINLILLIKANNHRKIANAEKRNAVPKEQLKKDDNTELLHKLLAEGKITIEEYDKLKNK